MKITVYTINDCQFSVQEKEYLKSLNLPFEEKNLETNRDFLTEMLAVSNNFAGTPVTKIEKDDGQIVVLKGFTKEEFDKALGTATPAAAPVVDSTPPAVTPVTAAPTVNINNFGAPMAPNIEQPVENTMAAMTPPPAETVPAQPVMPAPTEPMTAAPAAMPAPSQEAVAADINDTLSKLTSAMGTTPPATEPVPVQAAPAEVPSTVPPMPMQQEPINTVPMAQPQTAPASVAQAPAQTAPTTIDNPALNSILNNLEQKAGDNTPPATAPNTPPTQLS